MRFAYADPPYFGLGTKFYGFPEWDRIERHVELIEQLVAEYPDGWALSASSPSLRQLLPACPEDIRIGAWVKPFHVFKKGVRPAYAWEPLLFRGGRNQNPPTPSKDGEAITPRDWVSANITLRRGLIGTKPWTFCAWVLDVLGYDAAQDELVDLYPGSGVMGAVAAQGILV